MGYRGRSPSSPRLCGAGALLFAPALALMAPSREERAGPANTLRCVNRNMRLCVRSSCLTSSLGQPPPQRKIVVIRCFGCTIYGWAPSLRSSARVVVPVDLSSCSWFTQRRLRRRESDPEVPPETVAVLISVGERKLYTTSFFLQAARVLRPDTPPVVGWGVLW